MIKVFRPSNFREFPYESILKKVEPETVAANIMLILQRTGDTFRELSWDEYKVELKKDTQTPGPRGDFSKVKDYCFDPVKASRFCQVWADAYDEAAK